MALNQLALIDPRWNALIAKRRDALQGNAKHQIETMMAEEENTAEEGKSTEEKAMRRTHQMRKP